VLLTYWCAHVQIVVMDTLPPLPYMTLIERYLLYVLLFVGAVSASNSIMIFNSSDGEGSTKGDAFDSYSMWSSLILWVLVRLPPNSHCPSRYTSSQSRNLARKLLFEVGIYWSRLTQERSFAHNRSTRERTTTTDATPRRTID
jgi:hypothetical protein